MGDCNRCRRLGDMLKAVNKSSLDASGLMWEEVDKNKVLTEALEEIANISSEELVLGVVKRALQSSTATQKDEE